jgi:3-oxoacyl-[acyl-carrier-protein] synthase III
VSELVPAIRAIAYAFPDQSRTVRELQSEGKLQSDAALLEGFGFARVHVALEESPYALALEASSRLCESHDIDAESIGLLIYGGTPSALAFASAADASAGASRLLTTDRFTFPASRLQHELGAHHASVFALDQLACTTLFGAVRIARALMLSEGIDRVLCVASEFFPAHAGREAIFNCTSDAAVAILLDREGERNQVVGSTTVTKGYYWDAETQRNEIVASYFPTAKCVIERTIADAGWSPADVDWVIPHNVSLRSWEILLGLLQLPNARLWSENIARHGHTLAGDSFINLHDALVSGALRKGQKAVLFSYGYGAHWSGLAVEA